MAFDFTVWVNRFPELASRGTQAQIMALAADAASLYFDAGRVRDLARADSLTNLVVAHLVELFLPGGNTPAAQGLVGRITSAGEGSVNVSLDAGNTTTLSQSWWLQSKYGAMFWQLTGDLRRFRYVPGYPRVWPRFNPIP